MQHVWKIGDRLVPLPEDLRDGFTEEELISRNLPYGTVVGILEDYPVPGDMRLEVEWDEDDGDGVETREDPALVVGCTWDEAYLRVAVGKIGEKEPRARVATYGEAVDLIDGYKKTDPEGVARGEYYIDVPEELHHTIKKGGEK